MVLHCVIPKGAIGIEIQKDSLADFSNPRDMDFDKTVSLPLTSKTQILFRYRARAVYLKAVSRWSGGIAIHRALESTPK